MFADLHIHTTASDGSDKPEEVVYKAKKAGLQAIAVTDHDTFGGIDEATRAGRDAGVAVLAGIELSTELENKEVHILGYLINRFHPGLTAHLQFFKQSREERIRKMVRKLQKLDMPVTLQEVYSLAGGGTMGRPHVARVLVDKGVVHSVTEAFDRFIGRGGPAFVPREKYTPAVAVELIREAGGVPVLAHPGLARLDDYIPTMVRKGLQGIEVYHPQHSPVDIEHYLEMSRRLHLLATGGSDYHGRDARGHEALGTAMVSLSVVKKICRLAQKE